MLTPNKTATGNRRVFVKRLSLGIAGIAAAWGGFTVYQIRKHPKLSSIDAQVPLLDELAETIIPHTDTPGAKAAGCGAIIAILIKDCTDRSSQNRFIDGLDTLKDYCQSHYDMPFEALSEERRIAVLQHFEAKGKPAAGILGKAQRKLMGDSFFTTLKNLTVTAWCTSKVGATQGLAYDYIPGAYIADAPLQPGQHSWATQ